MLRNSHLRTTMTEYEKYILVGGEADGAVVSAEKNMMHISIPKRPLLEASVPHKVPPTRRMEIESYTLRTIRFYDGQIIRFYALVGMTEAEALLHLFRSHEQHVALKNKIQRHHGLEEFING